jgi:pulcherriminic acid synthase
VTSVSQEIVRDFDAVLGGSGDAERDALFERCRAEAPIFFSDSLGAWVLTRYDDVRGVLEDTEFLTLTEGPGAPIFGRSMLQWEGVEHNKKSGPIVKRIRSPRAIRESIDGKVAEIARRTADDLPLGEPVDLRADYVMLVPLLVITELLDIHEAGQFRELYDAIMKGGISSIADPALRVAAFAALERLSEIVAPVVEERRVDPGTDMISDLATAQYDGEPYPTEEIIATVAFLLTAGIETVERALTSLLRHLALDREEWERLRARIDDADYVLSLSAESLRLFPPVQGTIRRATVPVDFHGSTVAADDKVIVMIASANRDEERFEAATEFRAERYLDNPDRQFTNAGEILPFGAGRHHCAGSRLAGTEMVHSLQQLVRRVALLEPHGTLPGGDGLLLRSPPALPVILHPASAV